jgi:hypothetical protein
MHAEGVERLVQGLPDVPLHEVVAVGDEPLGMFVPLLLPAGLHLLVGQGQPDHVEIVLQVLQPAYYPGPKEDHEVKS